MPYLDGVVELVLEQGYRADSADQASAAMQAVFGVGTVAVESLGTLQFSQWSLVDDGISATRIESRGAVVRMDAEPAPDMVVIAVRTGYLVLQQGTETVALQAGDLGLVPLDQAVRASWEQVTMDLYSFPRASLNSLLSADTEQITLRVERLKAVSPAVVGLFTRAATTLAEEVLQNPELAESDVVREQSIDTLLGLTIEAFGITDAHEDHTDDDEARLQQAVAYMTRNIAKPISVTDVAREVGVSIRSLQLVFRRTGNGTPQAHLRALRMTAARRALTTSSLGTPVITVATRAGYSNLGRFSAHYLDAFGRLPEQDLGTTADDPSASTDITSTRTKTSRHQEIEER